MANLDQLRQDWNVATANLAPGEQRVFVDVLTLVKDEKKTNLVWGTDYSDGGTGACLVNAAGSMLSKGDGSGVPMQQFGEVVSLYDRINREFRSKDINTDHHVSPLAAEILLQWFAPLKKMPMEEIAEKSHFKGTDKYVEPTDEAMLESLLAMLTEPEAPTDVVDNPFAEFFDGARMEENENL